MALTDAVRVAMEASVLCWLATVSADGERDVSPKEIFAPLDDFHMVIAEIASPVSLRNARANGRVSVTFVDVFAQKGFKISGVARIVDSTDEGFARLGARVIGMAGDLTVRHLFVVRADRISRILAPSYQADPDTREQDKLAQAHRTYGVTAAERQARTGAGRLCLRFRANAPKGAAWGVMGLMCR